MPAAGKARLSLPSAPKLPPNPHLWLIPLLEGTGFTESLRFLSVVVSIIFVSMIALSCGGGGGGASENVERIENILFTDKGTFTKKGDIVTINFKDATLSAVEDQLLLHLDFNLTDEQAIIIKSELDRLNCEIVGQIPGVKLLQIEKPPGENYDKISEILIELNGIKLASLNLVVDNSIDFSPDYNHPQWSENEKEFDVYYWIKKNHINAREGWEILNSLGLPIGTESIAFIEENYNWYDWILGRQYGVTVYDINGVKLYDENVKFISGSSSEDEGYHGTLVSNFAAGDGHFDENDSEYNQNDAIGVSLGSEIKIISMSRKKNEENEIVYNDSYLVTDLIECVEAFLNNPVFENIRILNVSIAYKKNEKHDVSDWLVGQRDMRTQLDGSMKIANEKNKLIIFGSGNEKTHDDDSYYNYGGELEGLNFTNWQNNAIIVGGSNINHDDANYTLGAVVDIVAPSRQVGFCMPDGISAEWEVPHCISDSGTSFAAPMVAGTASLIWTLRDDLSAKQVKEIIVSSSNTKRISSWTETKWPDVGLLDVGNAIRKAVFYGLTPSFDGEDDGNALSDELFSLTWEKVEYATHYEIQWSESSDFLSFGAVIVQSTGDEVEQYTFSELFDLDSTYYFRIFADHEALEISTDWSPIKTVTFVSSSPGTDLSNPYSLLGTYYGYFDVYRRTYSDREYKYVFSERISCYFKIKLVVDIKDTSWWYDCESPIFNCNFDGEGCNWTVEYGPSGGVAFLDLGHFSFGGGSFLTISRANINGNTLEFEGVYRQNGEDQPFFFGSDQGDTVVQCYGRFTK